MKDVKDPFEQFRDERGYVVPKKRGDVQKIRQLEIEQQLKGTENVLPSLTQQHYRDECDVNLIIKKYQENGEIVHLSRKAGVYADVSEITDYQSSLNTVIKAQNAFATLPGEVRNRFQNDPAELLAFLQDPKNRDEAIKLGLIDKPAQVIDAEPETRMTTNKTTTNAKTKNSANVPANDPE